MLIKAPTKPVPKYKQMNYSEPGLGPKWVGEGWAGTRKKWGGRHKESRTERAGEEMIGDIFQGQRKYAGHLLL